MRSRRLELAAALMMCAAAAHAAPARPGYRLPKGWSIRADDKNGTYASNGPGKILIKRATDKEAAKLAPELYGGKPKFASADVEVSAVTVAGAKAKKVVRRYERSSGGGESAKIVPVYEELVVVPSRKKGQVWTVDFQAPRGSFDTEPQGGLDDWRAFLRSFKPI